MYLPEGHHRGMGGGGEVCGRSPPPVPAAFLCRAAWPPCLRNSGPERSGALLSRVAVVFEEEEEEEDGTAF